MSGLLGPDGAVQRLRELQARINQYTAPAPAAMAAGPTFAQTLQGCLPADPSNFNVGNSSQYQAMATSAATKYGIDPDVYQNLIHTESGWNPAARSGKGAVGLAQLMPSTAAALGVANPSDPAQSLEGGAKYLRQMLDHFGNDYTKAVAAYNAGPGAVEKSNGIPPYNETIAYVTKILGARKG